MKKTLFNFALILSILFSIPISAWAADTAGTYQLQNLHFTNLNGDTITDPPGSCMAAVRMANNSASGRTDLLIISAYSADNQLISFNILSAFCQSRSFQDFSALINVPEGKKLGVVKAYVWDSIKTMNAMSNTLSVEVNPPYVPVVPVYAAKGQITETYRSNANYGLDKAKFTFSSAFEDNGLTIPAGDSYIVNLKNIDPSENIGLPLNVKFEMDADKNLTLTAYSVDQNVKLVERPSSFVDACTPSAIQIYDTADARTPTKYNLASNAVFYVNGAAITKDTTSLQKYILNNPGETLTLADIGTSSSIADGLYDAVYIDFYGTAQLDAISNTTKRIFFSQYTTNISSSLTMAENTVSRYILAGEEIPFSALQSGDVLSIQYNVEDSFRYSPFYYIRVSRDTVEGKYTGNDPAAETIQIGETSYPVVLDGLSFDDWRQDSQLTLGENYACCLDAFGRIFAVELIPSVDNIAIADKVVSSSAFDNYGLTLYTTDGLTKTYEVDPNTPGWGNSRDAIRQIYNEEHINNNDKKDINLRVVKYKINSKGHITSLQILNAIKGDADFRAATRSVGMVRMNENTKVIDAIDYVSRDQRLSDLSIAGLSNFVDNQRYVVYGYGTRFSDGAYPFVLVTAGPGKYTEDTRMAVLASDPGLSYINQEDGQTVVMYTMDLLTADQDTPENFTAKNAILMMDGEQIDFETLKKGDLVVYALNANGQIKDMDVIFKADSYAVSGGYNTLASQLLTAGDHSDMLCLPIGTTKWTKEWKPFYDTPAQIVIGPIVEKTSNTFSIGKIANGTIGNYTGPYTSFIKAESEDGGILNVSINSGTRVYGYDYSAPSRSSLFIGTTGDLVKCDFARSELLEDQTVIPWNNLYSQADGVPAGMNIAIAKVVNGVAQDVFVYLGAQ